MTERSTVNNQPIESMTTCPVCRSKVPGWELEDHGRSHRHGAIPYTVEGEQSQDAYVDWLGS